MVRNKKSGIGTIDQDIKKKLNIKTWKSELEISDLDLSNGA